MAFLDIGGFVSDLKELQLDEELIKRIETDLVNIGQQIEDTRFRKFQVDQSVYGNSQVGWSLGYHHSLAHHKVSQTLTAVLEDLRTFREGFATYKKKVTDADTGSAADSKKVRLAIEALDRSTRFSHTHDVNQHYHTGDTGGAGGTDA